MEVMEEVEEARSLLRDSRLLAPLKVSIHKRGRCLFFEINCLCGSCHLFTFRPVFLSGNELPGFIAWVERELKDRIHPKPEGLRRGFPDVVCAYRTHGERGNEDEKVQANAPA